MSRCFLASVVGTLLAPALVYASSSDALWLEPSSQWYGIDGNWSSTRLFVGEPAQQVDVTVSTSLSEVWVVEDGGCGSSTLCAGARGGVYNTSASLDWSSMGPWQLGLDYLGYGGNGDYGMDMVVAYDSVHRSQTNLGELVVSAINTTDYYTGFFGVGMLAGNFDGTVAKSPIAALVEDRGTIPSHSYGYTAGAYYAGAAGVPMSLTLGGYDADRFEPHDTSFSLNGTSSQPEVLIRAITASVSDAAEAPTAWSSSSVPLASFNESVTALIDSSTPWLWLPSPICDRFASAMNLTWNDTFGLYLFPDNDNLERYSSAPDLSFTFSLSSTDNRDNFGDPLQVPGVVNITISANAFIQSLRYPFMNLIAYGDPAIPYFPLKRAVNGSRIILGRSFLQEAYLMTNYETGTFSVHKAKFPDNPLDYTSVQTIAASPDSPYPGPPKGPGHEPGLTQAQLAGLVVGICLVCFVLGFTLWMLFRRRKKTKQDMASKKEDDLRDNAYTPEPDLPKSPATHILSRLTKSYPWKRARKAKAKNVHEVGADASHERYEMPAPMAPSELDATNTWSSTYASDLGGKEPPAMHLYMVDQYHPDRQDHGRAPPYASRMAEDPATKTYHDASEVAHYRPSEYGEQLSPASSLTQDTYSNRMPSPLTPQSDWGQYTADLSSVSGFVPTRTMSASNPSTTYASSAALNSESNVPVRSASASSQRSSLLPPQAAYQRTPIDTSRVVCLGPLPEDFQPPIPRPFALPTIPSSRHSRRQSVAETLGSNFTFEEEAREAEAREAGRIDGFDIVHVPQPAPKRYSWEADP